MRKRIFTGLVVAMLMAAVVVLFLIPRPTTSRENLVEERATDVRVMEVRSAPLEEWIELPASAIPYTLTEVPAEVEGRIDWIGPNEGETIEKPGIPILRIDERSFRAQLEEAQAAHDLSVKKCQRAEELYSEGVFSDEQLDQCKMQVVTDAARLEIAKIQIDKAMVSAPIAGVLNRVYFDVGEYVRAGDRVADIVVIDPIKVVVSVPEKDIPYAHLGDKVSVLFDFLGKRNFEGTIIYTSVVGEVDTRTFYVTIRVANPKHEILPAMIASVKILKREIADAVTVPLIAILPRGDFAVVFVEEGGRANERPVEMGILDGSRIQIVKGLEPGDRLIVEGQRTLGDGELVRVHGSKEVE